MLATGFLLLAAATAAAGAVEADPEVRPVEVQLDGPEGCSNADVFYGFLRSRTNRVRKADATEARTTLQVRVSRGRGQVLGELRMVDDQGGTDTRKVQGASCDEVVQALSLTAALALDPTALSTATAPAPGEDASTGAMAGRPPAAEVAANRSPPLPPAPSEPTTVTKPRPVPAFELTAEAFAMTVVKGGWSPGVALAARKTFGKDGVLIPTFGLAVGYARNDVFQSPQDAEIALASMTASACPLRLTASLLTVEPCAVLMGGWLNAAGRQLTLTSTVDRFWLSAGAIARASVFLGLGLSLDLEGGATVPILARRFYVTVPGNVVAETPTIAPLVGMGLTYGW